MTTPPLRIAALLGLGLALATPAPRAQEAKPRLHLLPKLKRVEDFAPPEEFVMAGGVKTHFIRRGDRGRPVVLIHGFGASTYSWRRNIDALAEAGYRVFAYDIRGFGLTEKPRDGRYHLSAYVEHLRDFLRALKLERPVLVGNSMGGAIALQFALEHPERVAGVVLVNASPVGEEIRFEAPGNGKVKMTPELVRLLITPRLVERTARTAYHHPELVTPEMVATYHRPILIEGMAEALIAMMDPPPDRPERLPPLEGLKVPLLLAWGRHDRLFPPAMAEALAAKIPGARVVLFEDSAHVPHEEEPEAFNRAVIDFLRGTGPSDRPRAVPPPRPRER